MGVPDGRAPDGRVPDSRAPDSRAPDTAWDLLLIFSGSHVGRQRNRLRVAPKVLASTQQNENHRHLPA